ncbi:MAG: hypothetical protein J3K34DRAFT_525348 [Monoraphidium minutum]|nr:MAG: hypothetical protein J3K34DRAFT_525348 [Monoraphidium minutum]
MEVAADVAPCLGGAEVEAAQACYLPVTGDGLPLIGRLLFRWHCGGGGAEVEAAQVCYLSVTGDGLPLIGMVPGAHGVFVGAGHSCW